jgi:hypothetical protein
VVLLAAGEFKMPQQPLQCHHAIACQYSMSNNLPVQHFCYVEVVVAVLVAVLLTLSMARPDSLLLAVDIARAKSMA